MYTGRIVEEGPVQKVLTSPQHPYTQGLLAASPSLERKALTPIPGTVPQLTELPPGCAFAPRCSFRRAECDRAVPEFRQPEPDILRQPTQPYTRDLLAAVPEIPRPTQV